MTLKDLAGDRITPGQISLVESGRSNPSMDLLEYLAQTLKTSVEYLMESEETQAEKICSYYEQVAESYILAEDIEIAESFIEKALYYAEKYNLEYRKARNLFLRAKAYKIKKNLVPAQQYFLAANVIFMKNNNYEEIVDTFLNLGKITLDLKAYHSAISYLQQAEKAYCNHEIGNDYVLGNIYFNMAKTYFKLEDFTNAMNYAILSKEKFEQIYDRKKYAKNLLLLAEEFNQNGDLTNAIKYSAKSLGIYKEINNLDNISNIEHNLGRMFYEFENIEESFKHFEISKRLRLERRDTKLTETLTQICENYIQLKDIASCSKVLEEMEEHLNEGGLKAIVEYNLLKYRLCLLRENFVDAESILKETLELAKNNKDLNKAGEIAIILGKFYLERRNDSEAAKYLDEGVSIFKELGTIKN